ncbi:Hypothetical predicted protein [Pelobates cultripes]|uniref:Uncharacterized protein n=1 Tax=Pelobates cultripes TaxID=61616 RepID=A0AAD1THS8_PELCU|nr:Hypothetical predicted protein [Pelobates cultripes]
MLIDTSEAVGIQTTEIIQFFSEMDRETHHEVDIQIQTKESQIQTEDSLCENKDRQILSCDHDDQTVQTEERETQTEDRPSPPLETEVLREDENTECRSFRVSLEDQISIHTEDEVKCSARDKKNILLQNGQTTTEQDSGSPESPQESLRPAEVTITVHEGERPLLLVEDTKTEFKGNLIVDKLADKLEIIEKIKMEETSKKRKNLSEAGPLTVTAELSETEGMRDQQHNEQYCVTWNRLVNLLILW